MDAPTPSHTQQHLLDETLTALANETDSDATEFLICLYLPLLSGAHTQLLDMLAKHKNFFVREAVAETLGENGVAASQATIHALASDDHPQVRDAALRAQERIVRNI
jgi:HEAT repeat protein